MKATIWHNPNCGTSRNVLAQLQARGDLELEVVEYLEDPPSRAKLASSDCVTVCAMRPNSVDGMSTLVATQASAGFSVLSARPRFCSDAPSPYATAVSK